MHLTNLSSTFYGTRLNCAKRFPVISTTEPSWIIILS